MSIILKRVKSHLIFNVIFAVSVFILNYFTNLVRPPPVALLSACSTALGLLLVFRTAGQNCIKGGKSVKLGYHLGVYGVRIRACFRL